MLHTENTPLPDVVATLILTVFEFPVIHSHPYNKFIYLNVGKLNETCTLGTLEMTFLICLLIIMHFAPNKVPEILEGLLWVRLGTL